MELELGLGLALPSPALVSRELDLLNSVPGSCGKRNFEALFSRGDDHDDDDENGDAEADGEMGNKRRKLVGWPPVKSLHRRRDGDGGGYVKVKMEGVAIGRKLDLSILGSYDELLDTLHRMFPSTNQGSVVVY
uniref:Auxin-responsive protein n=1 Tax=Leersia perrieri TaxID=77586 RepID=A0A0D9WMA9_9ORYZ